MPTKKGRGRGSNNRPNKFRKSHSRSFKSYFPEAHRTHPNRKYIFSCNPPFKGPERNICRRQLRSAPGPKAPEACLGTKAFFFFSIYFFSVGYLQVILLICRFPPGNCKGSAPSRFLTFSVSNFSIIFGMPFFRHFTPFGAPLAPLWLLLGILDAFWAPFWLPFGSLLLQICIPFSNLVFVSILH